MPYMLKKWKKKKEEEEEKKWFKSHMSVDRTQRIPKKPVDPSHKSAKRHLFLGIIRAFLRFKLHTINVFCRPDRSYA